MNLLSVAWKSTKRRRDQLSPSSASSSPYHHRNISPFSPPETTVNTASELLQHQLPEPALPSPVLSDDDDPFGSRSNSIRRIRSREFWMEDAKAFRCYSCNLPFSLVRRKHHCRICGQIFCGKCATVQSAINFQLPGELRICVFCQGKDEEIMNPYGYSFDDDRISLSELSLNQPDCAGTSYDENWSLRLRGASPSTTLTRRGSDARRLERELNDALSHDAASQKYASDATYDSSSDDESDDSEEEEVEQSYLQPNPSNLVGSTNLKSLHHTNTSSASLIPTAMDFRPSHVRKRSESHQRPIPAALTAPASLKHIIQRIAAEQAVNNELPLSSTSSLARRPTLHRVRRPVSSVQINAVAVNHLKTLLAQELREFRVLNAPEWESVFLTFLLKLSETLHPDVKAGDPTDPNIYVKIKRIPGGTPSDSRFMDGLVITKSIAHKSMPAPIANPQILLLAFALDYRPVETPDTMDLSIEALVSQEKEHAKKLVARILTLSPDLVLVEKSVSRSALEFLLEARVTLVPNVKPSVMQAVARCTQADIVTFEKLAQAPRLGTCALFRMQTFFHPDIPRHRKTYLYFEGARKEVGCTIVLRGQPLDELAKVKALTQFMVQVAYSLRLETSLLQDEFALLPNTPSSLGDEPCTITNGNRNTPIDIPPPYTLVRQRELVLAHHKHQHRIVSSVAASSAALNTLPPLAPAPPRGDRTSTASGHVHDSSDYIAEVVLSPLDYQSITVLRSTSGDMTLGKYIERIYMLANYLCRCGSPWLNHVRSYAHNEGKVDVIVQAHPCPIVGMDESVLMWSECRICKASTQPVPMSEDTWAFSFGKYLELTFYHTGMPCRANLCPHDIHRSHVRWFAYRGLGIRVEYSKIDLYEVIFPPMRLEWDSHIHEVNKEEDREILHTRISRFYTSVRKKLQSLLNHENHNHRHVLHNLDKDKLAHILGLQRQALGDRKHMLQVLQRTFTNSAKDDTFASSVVYHELLGSVSKWEEVFARILGVARSPADRRSAHIGINPGSVGGNGNPNSTNSNGSSKPVDIMPPPLPPRHFNDSLPILGSSPSQEAMDVYLKAQAVPPTALEVVELKSLVSKQSKDKSYKGYSSMADPDSQKVMLVAPTDILPIVEEEDTKPPPFMPVNGFDSLDAMTPASKPPLGDRYFYVPSSMITDIIADERMGGPLFEWTVPKDIELDDMEEEVDKEEEAALTTVAGQLQYPWSPLEHIHPESPVILREDEPSSVIAFTLRSKQYQHALAALRADARLNVEVEKPICIDFDDITGDADGSQLKFSCQVFYAEEFEELRAACGIDKLYVESLARCFKYDTSGGRSGMLFLKTRDTRFMIKQLSRAERDALEHFAPMYLEHMSRAATTKLPTTLAKIFGFYTIKIKHSSTNKNTRLDLFVMEDLFFGKEDIKVFDLKGSERNRHVQSTGRRGEVFLDSNFVEYIYKSPLFLREHSKKMLRACVWNDTIFLSKQGVMDYSLLVGVDQKRQELVVGIVDFIRTFTWDKRLESFVKDTGLLGGGGKQPTIVKPKVYKRRFRNSMESYFLCVPDKHSPPL
ncbi:hypothetical protein SeMB42_g02620 [Synchytrium endobioticum]|uniref:1-phosphatidylinositol-3-phosphate 5-kinase n=1 Tax=Synchytrium endobioticum TaxID=286115 RepID=A0A507DCG7_9FUNG|nr:hypothetical protein SeMB42_g02620 [Synchytrium endobioticum]